jgi:hypothetical protein
MQNLSKKVENLPSLQPEALKEIIKGLYQGKSLQLSDTCPSSDRCENF